jgi:hypothetical protein
VTLGRHAGRSIPRRIAGALVASIVVLALGSSVGVGPALAATDFLRESVVTTYRVDGAKGAVHVTLDIRATNTKPSSATTYYYFNTLSFGIQAEARSIAASSNGRRLDVTVTSRPGYRDVLVHTPRLLYRQTRSTRLTFDLPSGKPRSDSPIRVGKAHAEFTAWSWGDDNLADVRIVLPHDFDADVHAWPDESANQPRSTVRAGFRTFAVDDIPKPDEWYATVDASDAGALTDVDLGLTDRPIAIHAWPEDKEWLDQVSTVLKSGLPRLEDAIGLPWPVKGTLEVSEVSTAEIDGYAGIYDSFSDDIQMSEDLDPQVIVHEASHAWFDGSFFAQRWIGEGLADEYASIVVAATEGGPRAEPPRVTPRSAGNFMLNAWPPPSRVDDETELTERYGYNASWTVIHELMQQIGEPGMRDVFAAAAKREIAYVGAVDPEQAAIISDWRRFLDLVEGVGGAKDATRLFSDWVVTPTETSELTARSAARARYDELVTHGGDWLPGILVRRPMSTWDFETATAAIDAAEQVLDERDQLTAATAELGLGFPGTLEPDYERATKAEDLDALESRSARWLEAAAAVRSAREALAATRPPLTTIGLIGSEPERAYVAALAAWNAGDDAGAKSGSADTLAVLTAAEAIGRDRALAIGGATALALLLLLVVAARLVRRHRRHQQTLATASASAEPDGGVPSLPAEPFVRVAVVDPPEPYATLAATPGPVEEAGSERGVVGGTEAD